MDIYYTLRVNGPDELDADLAAEIAEDADVRDTTDKARMRRWLGGHISDAERDLSQTLPDGWHAKISEDRLDD